MIRMRSSKRGFSLALAVGLSLLSTLFFGVYFFGLHERFPSIAASTTKRNGRFHLLVPATASNEHLCKLLLSTAINDYPEPVFIGWGGHGMYNGSESHLFKISETLSYLRSLPASADDDLVLLLDGYDIWVQLRIDVMISRYYKVIEKNNQQLQDEAILGQQHGGGEIKQTVVFGPDKVCWPQGAKDPACWAVPHSTMAQNAFGPDTDRDLALLRPIFLNSGTIMGPVKDMRDVFAAAMDHISRKYDPAWELHSSDQFYFAEVWAEQEIGRLRLRDGKIDVTGPDWIVPEIPPTRRTEYHITLDYDSKIFQTAAWYADNIAWMSFNHSSPIPQEQLDRPQQTLRMDQWTLGEDILKTRPPFADSKYQPELPQDTEGWTGVMLGTNSLTQEVFPLFHMTGDKSLRERWWSRMWFQPYGRQLLNAAMRRKAESIDPSIITVVDGVTWRAARHDLSGGTASPPAGDSIAHIGGGWSDRGEYLHWNSLCRIYEPHL